MYLKCVLLLNVTYTLVKLLKKIQQGNAYKSTWYAAYEMTISQCMVLNWNDEMMRWGEIKESFISTTREKMIKE